MPESEPRFIDSNIWLYAFTEDDSRKAGLARAVIAACQPVISVQVINEVCVNLIRKARFPEARIAELIETFYRKYVVMDLQQEALLKASELRREYSLSYWDSLIVSAAVLAGAEIIYSEDMQDGLSIRKSLQIVNPFKSVNRA